MTEGLSESLQAHFDRRAASYEDITPWVTDPVALDPIAELVARIRPERVLELGVGTGAVPDYLQRRSVAPPQYFGLDISPEMLRHARTWTPVQGDAAELPFDAGTIDLVIARQVFHYFGEPARVVREAHRVLRPHGMLVVAQIVAFDAPEDLAWWSRTVSLRQPLRRHALSAAMIDGLLADGGFRVESTTEVFGRSSLKNWLRRYEIAPGAEAALVAHVRAAPEPVSRLRAIEVLEDDVRFSIRWTIKPALRHEDWAP